MNIDSIQNGFVIDHIPAGKGMKLYELLGLSAEAVEHRLAEDRQRQIGTYAYLIMHNAGMAHREKKRLILALDAAQGQALYRQNVLLYWKERIVKWLLFKS